MVPSRKDRPHIDRLAVVHERFGRAVVAIYVVTAMVALAMLVAALVTDRAHQEDDACQTVLLETQVRADALARHLGLLASELRRLGLRSEMNLLDENLEPERSLLRLSHDRSAFFDIGVAILGVDGVVVWSEPQEFLRPGTSLGDQPWFDRVKRQRSVHIVPVEPERENDSSLYLVSPLIREGRFEGALLGALDLARGDKVPAGVEGEVRGTSMLATTQGAVVYPPRPPPDLDQDSWRSVLDRAATGPFVTNEALLGFEAVVAVAPVHGADLLLLRIVDRRDLFGPASVRFAHRLAMGLVFTAAPVVVLVWLLRRSFRQFRRSEEEAVREERLRRLGEAVNLIAHEIRNALNGLGMALDVLLTSGPAPGESPAARAAVALRSETRRLSEFTDDLLSFSKGVTPRPVKIDLGQIVRDAVEVLRESAAEAGVTIEISGADAPVPVRADPGLVHVVVANLLKNAIEALVTTAEPRIEVEIGTDRGFVQVRVRDNGPGILPEVQSRLFEPFVTGKTNGVGIGLALSRQIARAHGGDLVAEPVRSGATFLFTLPVEAP